MFGKIKRKGFTLVELLLVILILGIIAVAVVQQFGVSEAEAKNAVSGFNKGALEKAIMDFHSVHGVYPSNWHTGFEDAGATTSMDGLSLEIAVNMGAAGTTNETVAAANITNNYAKGCQVTTPGPNVQTLTADQVMALRDKGIHGFATGTPTKNVFANITPLSETAPSAWILTGGADLYRGSNQLPWSGGAPGDYELGDEVVTMNGRALSEYTQWSPTDAVLLVFVTENVAWSAVFKGDKDATGNGSMIDKGKIGFTKAGVDPNAPAEGGFPYYLAAFYLSPGAGGSNIGSKAGIWCDFLGILDSDLNPVSP